MAFSAITLRALDGIPEIRPGDSLVDVVLAALARNQVQLAQHEVVAICQKVVSKSENRYVNLDTITPSERAVALADRCGKDARMVELVLRESTAVVRCVKDVLIVRHRLGFVVANAGIDQSNIEDGDRRALLLPEDPDQSASRIREDIARRLGVNVAVVITDSFGRAWRLGVTGTCIGCAGLVSLLDARGRPDRFGRPLRITQVAVADQVASAATLVMGEAAEGWPVVIVSGLTPGYFAHHGSAVSLLRSVGDDLFQ
jgi:coenzyme F420-0:L-glutamate ligase/coenzyme F420-1:gamma-L-glutamate ligase